jgi:NADPH-dependent curcumin reductase CurA
MNPTTSKSSAMNHQWRLSARPKGMVQESDFEWHEEPLRELAEGEVLVRTLYLSLDPTNRVWMNDADSYMPKLPLGAVMRGGAIGVVERSRNAAFAEGDIVQGLIGWQEYLIDTGAGLSKLPRIPGIPLDAYFGAMGHIGFTAYFGLLDIGKPREGDTLVVSAAAGAVGSIAGQIGKLKGCRVVGIAGSDDKCHWITTDLGFDAAINYKTEDVGKALRSHCPGGIDIDFENVGGTIMEAVLDNLKLNARIVLCGMISQYNEGSAAGPRNFGNILMKRALVKGFIVFDYAARYGEAATDIIRWLSEGKLKYRIDQVEGLRSAPSALQRLFKGSNTGKLLVKVSAER